MKNITIVGWHNHKNFGDYLMFLEIIEILQKKYKKISLKIFADKINFESASTLGIDYVFLGDRVNAKILKKVFLYFEATWKTDILIFGGGSIFHSSKSIFWKLIIVTMFKVFNPKKKAFLISVSLGPFTDKYAIFLMRIFLFFVNVAIFRDRESLKKSAELEKKSTLNVRIFQPDISSRFLKKAPHVDLGSSLNLNSFSGKILGINVGNNDPRFCTDLNYLNYLSEFLSLTYLKFPYEKVYLFNFCDDPIFGDTCALEALEKLIIPEVKKKFIPYTHLIKDVNLWFSEIDLFIGMRLHSQILGILHNVPTLRLIYHEKNVNVINSLGSDRLQFLVPILDPSNTDSRKMCLDFLDSLDVSKKINFTRDTKVFEDSSILEHLD